MASPNSTASRRKTTYESQGVYGSLADMVFRQTVAHFSLFVALLFLQRNVAAAGDAPGDKRAKGRQLFAEAQIDYQRGDLAAARQKLEAAYKLTPSPEMAFNIGRVCERMGEAACGSLYFRTYLKTAKLSAEERQDIETRIQNMLNIAKKQRDQVFTTLPSGSALADEARKFFLRGVAMFKRKSYLAALQAFTAAQRFSPVPELYYNMGVTAEALQRDQDAIDYFREYLRLRPSSSDRLAIEARIQALRQR